MLDFRRHSNVPNYLGAKDQRRLLVLVALAALVAILVFRFGDPRKERWFAGIGPADGEQQAHRTAADAQGARAPGDRDALFPGVRRDYLSEVQDDEVFRTAESDAWFHLLEILDRTNERELEKASVGRVGFTQLDQQASEYRGRLVTIQGVVRGAKLVAAPKNSFGIKQYYQLWLQPERVSPALVVVYALKLPEGFPVGTPLEASSTATGFFFKRWAYRSQGGIATAPLILARTIDWQPPPAPPPEAPLGEQMVWTLVVALLLAVLTLGWLVARGRGATRSRRLADGEQVAAALASRELVDRANRGDDTKGDLA